MQHDLIKYMKFEHTVTAASWNEERGEWDVSVRGPDGSEFKDTCNVLINGGGILKYVFPCRLLSCANVYILVTGSGPTYLVFTASRAFSHTQRGTTLLSI